MNASSYAPDSDHGILEQEGPLEMSYTGASQTVMCTQAPGDPVKTQILMQSLHWVRH